MRGKKRAAAIRVDRTGKRGGQNRGTRTQPGERRINEKKKKQTSWSKLRRIECAAKRRDLTKNRKKVPGFPKRKEVCWRGGSTLDSGRESGHREKWQYAPAGN